MAKVTLQRDLFGQLLAIALEKKIDISKVLTYPLTSIPLSLCHPDASINKTNKSVLLHILEKGIVSQQPTEKDLVIYDGFFILHQMKNLPQKYDQVAIKLLCRFLKEDSRFAIVVFDTYFSPSIKDYEHTLRGTYRGQKIEIRGSFPRPSDFSAQLKNITFKEDFVKFLLDKWADNEMSHFFENKILYVNYDICYRYEVINEKVIRTVDNIQSCPDHEEADTKIVYNVCNFEEVERPLNILVRCSDTDILVILLSNMKFVRHDSKVWMEAGTGASLRFVDVSQLYEKLGENICNALAGFHALTGCDQNPAFFRKGKKRPYSILLKNENFIAALSDLSKYPSVDDTIFAILEEYVCRIYGQGKTKKIDEMRTLLFSKAYKNFVKDEKLLLEKVKDLDASCIPPCQTELRQHLLRTAYLSQIWCNAHKKKPTNLSPIDCGWKNDCGQYVFYWFDGDQVPRTINDISFEVVTGNCQNF